MLILHRLSMRKFVIIAKKDIDENFKKKKEKWAGENE